jgi:hypothetical protein
MKKNYDTTMNLCFQPAFGDAWGTQPGLSSSKTGTVISVDRRWRRRRGERRRSGGFGFVCLYTGLRALSNDFFVFEHRSIMVRSPHCFWVSKKRLLDHKASERCACRHLDL